MCPATDQRSPRLREFPEEFGQKIDTLYKRELWYAVCWGRVLPVQKSHLSHHLHLDYKIFKEMMKCTDVFSEIHIKIV